MGQSDEGGFGRGRQPERLFDVGEFEKAASNSR
jgi:hypothetical protein